MSVQDTSAQAKKGLTDTPLRTSFLGLTCLFGLQGLFGFMPHGLAVLLEFVVACLFPWTWADFQKISTIHQELQVLVILQTCGEDKSKTAHSFKAHSERQICGSFPSTSFLWMQNKQRGLYCRSVVQLRKEHTHSWVQLLRKKTWLINFYVKHKRLHKKTWTHTTGTWHQPRPAFRSNWYSTNELFTKGWCVFMSNLNTTMNQLGVMCSCSIYDNSRSSLLRLHSRQAS